MFGMFQSVTTKSKGLDLSFCSATAPSSASSTLAKPSSFNRLRTMRRMVEKSSTTRKRVLGSDIGVLRVLCLFGQEVRRARCSIGRMVSASTSASNFAT